MAYKAAQSKIAPSYPVSVADPAAGRWRGLEMVPYLVVRFFLMGLAFLPGGAARALCCGIAAAFYGLDRKHRSIGLINLDLAFPERPRAWKNEVLRRSFQRLGDLAVELSRLDRLSPAELKNRVRYEEGRGLENYLKARRQGKGVLFLTAHLSAWELLPLAHACYGYPLSFVVRPLQNPYLEKWSRQLRSQFGNQVLPKRGSLLRIMKIIRGGGEVGFLIDQNIQEKEGVFVPLFGRPACTSSSLAALALKTGAPVVPGFIYPEGKSGHYRIRFYPALAPIRTGDPQRDLEENTAHYNRIIEEVVREFPECWLWGHRRFKTQPDGSDPYSG